VVVNRFICSSRAATAIAKNAAIAQHRRHRRHDTEVASQTACSGASAKRWIFISAAAASHKFSAAVCSSCRSTSQFGRRAGEATTANTAVQLWRNPRQVAAAPSTWKENSAAAAAAAPG